MIIIMSDDDNDRHVDDDHGHWKCRRNPMLVGMWCGRHTIHRPSKKTAVMLSRRTVGGVSADIET